MRKVPDSDTVPIWNNSDSVSPRPPMNDRDKESCKALALQFLDIPRVQCRRYTPLGTYRTPRTARAGVMEQCYNLLDLTLQKRILVGFFLLGEIKMAQDMSRELRRVPPESESTP
jgi:hypothetical protein